MTLKKNICLLFKQSARIAVPDDDFCESVWQLQIEPPFSDTVMHRNAMLSATVVNTGEVSVQHLL